MQLAMEGKEDAENEKTTLLEILQEKLEGDPSFLQLHLCPFESVQCVLGRTVMTVH